MKLLSNIDRALVGGRGRAHAQADAAPVGDFAGAIGERYETIRGGLDTLADLVEQLRVFGPTLSEMREPLNAEFEARREDYVELVGLRAMARESTDRIEALTQEARGLKAALAGAEGRHEDAAASLAELGASSQALGLEADRLRNALAQAEARLEDHRTEANDAVQRVRQLEQDLEITRTQLGETDVARTEALGLRARAERDHALITDENAAVKKRLDEATIELARLSRVEGALESQLAAERNRASSESAEVARTVRALETQAETARGEAAALQVRLDTLTARSDRLEKLNSDLSVALNEAQNTLQARERNSSHMQLDLSRAGDRIRELEAAAEDTRQRSTTMETARLAAVDRAEHLSKSTAVGEKALARSEAQVAALQAQMAELKLANEAEVKALTGQADALRATLEGARAESAMTLAALEAARRDRVALSVVGETRRAASA